MRYPSAQRARGLAHRYHRSNGSRTLDIDGHRPSNPPSSGSTERYQPGVNADRTRFNRSISHRPVNVGALGVGLVAPVSKRNRYGVVPPWVIGLSQREPIASCVASLIRGTVADWDRRGRWAGGSTPPTNSTQTVTAPIPPTPGSHPQHRRSSQSAAYFASSVCEPALDMGGSRTAHHSRGLAARTCRSRTGARATLDVILSCDTEHAGPHSSPVPSRASLY